MTYCSSFSEQQRKEDALHRESSLGLLDFQACLDANKTATSQKRNSYQKWNEVERYHIEKYASIYGHANAVRKFQTKSRLLNESTVRRFAKLYQEEIENARKQKRTVSNRIETLQRGRPLLLGSLDEMVRNFLLALRNRGGLVTSVIAVSAAKALIARNSHLCLSHIDLDSSSWAKSLFKRMGFKRRMKTTGKVEIPEGARKEAEFLYLYKITSLIEKFKIPESLVLNLDQTPLKFVPAMNHTMAKRNSKSVSINGSSDKRSITATFVITLSGHFLPIQLIYGGKTKQSLPRFKFPDSFSLSCNPKHYSNTEESLKLIDEILVPYVNSQQKILQNPKQEALLIMDVFRGQITDDVTNRLKENNIHVVLVPNNMTHLFQPLDLTVNKHCKSFLKNCFSEWYSQQIANQLAVEKKMEEIEINFKLTTIKPLHAKWVVEFYSEITAEPGAKVIVNGWKASGIFDAVEMGSTALPSVDPFHDISPLIASDTTIESELGDHLKITDEIKEHFVNDPANIVDDEEEEWLDENDVDFNRNAFDIIIDDEEE